MSAPALATKPHVPALEDQLYRLTVKQYHKMIDTGVIKEGDKVELLEGWVYQKMPHHPPAAGTISVMNGVLTRRLLPGWIIRIQLPITTTDSEPEPDLIVTSGVERDYLTRHPDRNDIAIVIEVADSTVPKDRTVKTRVYALAKLPIYWLVNIPEMQIEVYTNPRGGKNPGYRERVDFKPDDVIPFVVGGEERGPIPVRDLLP